MNESAIEFHNVTELESAATGGRTLRRFPASVRNTLSPLGRMVSQDAAGCEIRFVTEAQSFALPSPPRPHAWPRLNPLARIS
jgi:hypothetical protein